MRHLKWVALVTLITAFLAPPRRCIAQTSSTRPTDEIPGDPKLADSGGQPQRQMLSDSKGADSNSRPAAMILKKEKKPDRNRSIYYKNKLEFSFETGWLPNNIPFVFDFLVSDRYTCNPLSYTLVPNMAALRWHLGNIGGPWVLRGNWDLSFLGGYTIIPRGPETRFFSYDMAIRRNFVQRNWPIAPYIEFRAGVGDINAKGPLGVRYAQGQDQTFTIMVGSGFRYNLSPRFSLSTGVLYMHVSNAYLSEPKYEDYGINVYGPTVGLYMRLGKPRRSPPAY